MPIQTESQDVWAPPSPALLLGGGTLGLQEHHASTLLFVLEPAVPAQPLTVSKNLQNLSSKALRCFFF